MEHQSQGHNHDRVFIWQPQDGQSADIDPDLDIGRKRRTQACQFCKLKKVRCNGGVPCTQCLDRGQTCIRDLRARNRPQGKKRKRNDPSREKLTGESSMHHGSNEATANTVRLPAAADFALEDAGSIPASNSTSSLHETVVGNGAAHVPESTPPSQHGPLLADATVSSGDDLVGQRAIASSAPHRLAEEVAPPLPEIDHEESSVCPDEPVSSSQYHGPASFFSICSRPAIRWVSQRVGSQGFKDTAYQYLRGVVQELKMERKISRERAPEPEPETAWKYVQAYFDKGYEVPFGVVDRHWFEARLRKHQIAGTSDEADAAWYALRNVVYASGCRISVSRTDGFAAASSASWPFFENALSVHTDLILMRTSMVGLQALTLMAYFAEGLGGPMIQYMLCATALHLACTMGLHRQPSRSWAMGDEVVRSRSRAFWALYCLEKALSARSGRPSAMSDEDITLSVPDLVGADSIFSSPYASILIRLSRFSSAIGRRLQSGQALRQAPREVAKTVLEMDGELRKIQKNVEHILKLDEPIDLNRLPAGMGLGQALSLQSFYLGLIFDLHSSLAYPWFFSALHAKDDQFFHDQRRSSLEKSAKAARAALMATALIHVDGSCPMAVAFYTPIYAMIIIFVYILLDPTLPCVQSDKAVLDVGVGHFARLEIATDFKVSIPFAKALARLASQSSRGVNRGDADEVVGGGKQFNAIAPDSSLLSDPTLANDDWRNEDYTNYNVFDMDFSNVDLELWSLLTQDDDFNSILACPT